MRITSPGVGSPFCAAPAAGAPPRPPAPARGTSCPSHEAGSSGSAAERAEKRASLAARADEAGGGAADRSAFCALGALRLRPVMPAPEFQPVAHTRAWGLREMYILCVQACVCVFTYTWTIKQTMGQWLAEWGVRAHPHAQGGGLVVGLYTILPSPILYGSRHTKGGSVRGRIVPNGRAIV